MQLNHGLLSAQKCFWLFNLSVISASSYLAADLTSFLVAGKVESLIPEVREKKARSTTASRLKPSLGFYSVISTRNIFSDDQGESLEKPAGGAPESKEKIEEKGDLAKEPPPVSSLNMVLVGTSVIGSKGYIAILENKATREQQGYRIGDELLPDVTIVDISRGSVTILRNGKREVIYYPEIGGKKRGAGAGKRLAARGRKPKGKSVSDITTTRKILDKRYVDNELKDMGRLLTQIRAVPVGKKGFKVFNIVKGSIFEKIGLKNGDMLKRINGLDMSSPDKAMEMYMQLKGATELQLDIARDGAMLSYNYTIR
ncbi:MAG: type II secretion system protein GspC [Nitrospinota bacterium]